MPEQTPVTVGLKNFSVPSPLGYRRFMNAMILCFVPMVTGLVQGLPMKDDTRNIWMLAVAAIPVLLKGIGMILGDGQVYSPTDEQMDKINEDKKDQYENN